MKIYDIGSYPGKQDQISIQKETDLLPKIKEQLKAESELSDTRIDNLQIIAGTIVTKEKCFVKINDSGWLPLLEVGDYYTISFEDVSINKIQLSENVTLVTFAYYFI